MTDHGSDSHGLKSPCLTCGAVAPYHDLVGEYSEDDLSPTCPECVLRGVVHHVLLPADDGGCLHTGADLSFYPFTLGLYWFSTYDAFGKTRTREADRDLARELQLEGWAAPARDRMYRAMEEYYANALAELEDVVKTGACTPFFALLGARGVRSCFVITALVEAGLRAYLRAGEEEVGYPRVLRASARLSSLATALPDEDNSASSALLLAVFSPAAVSTVTAIAPVTCLSIETAIWGTIPVVGHEPPSPPDGADEPGARASTLSRLPGAIGSAVTAFVKGMKEGK